MKKMYLLSFSLVIFALCKPQKAYAQVDYLSIKNQYTLSCGIPSVHEINQNTAFVDSLFTMKFDKGHTAFLYDYGMTYYHRYLKWKDKKDLLIAIDAFEQNWEQYEHMGALWNLGSMYRLVDECEKSLDATELYIEKQEKIDPSQISYKQVFYRYKNCRH